MIEAASQDTEATRTAPPPLWRNRDFMLLRSGQAISVIGTRVSTLAFPLLVLAIGGTPGEAALVEFFNALPQLLFNLPAGALVDRWDRRRVMIICDAARACALGSIPVALLLGHPPLLQLAIVAFLEGGLSVFFNLAEGAAIPQVVAREQLPAAYAQNETVRRGAVMVGPPLGGILFGFGQLFPFLGDAVSYAVSVVSLLFIRTRFQAERVSGAKRSMRADIAEGVAWLWQRPFMRMATLLVAGTNLLFGAVYLVLIVLASRRGASPAMIGIMFGLGGVGGVIGAVLAGIVGKRLRLGHVVLGVNWLWALLLPLFAIAPNAWVIGALNAVMVFAGPFWNVLLGSYTRAMIPDELQARVDAASTVVSWGAIPLGPALAGLLLAIMSPVQAILVLSALMLLIAIAGTLSRAVRSAGRIDEVQ